MKNLNNKFLITLFILFFFTGCANIDISMEIGKDKSMNFEMIEAFDESLKEYLDTSSNDEISKYENSGFYVQKYNENGKVGYKMTKQIKNIDDVSTETNISKDEMTEGLSGNNQYMFIMKKGFFKNSYHAVYSFNMANYNNYSNNLENTEYDENCRYEVTEDLFSVNCELEPIEDQEANKLAYEEYIEKEKQQLEEYTNNLDLKFNLKLPYKVRANNATTVTNGGKNLVWDLSKVNDIEFEFDIYDMTKIYIAGGITLLVLIILIISIKSLNSNKKKPTVNKVGKDYQPNFLNNNEIIDESYSQVYQSNNNETLETYNNMEPENNYSNEILTYEDVIKQNNQALNNNTADINQNTDLLNIDSTQSNQLPNNDQVNVDIMPNNQIINTEIPSTTNNTEINQIQTSIDIPPIIKSNDDQNNL